MYLDGCWNTPNDIISNRVRAREQLIKSFRCLVLNIFPIPYINNTQTRLHSNSEANTEVSMSKPYGFSFTVMLLLLPERLKSENWRWLKVSHHWQCACLFSKPKNDRFFFPFFRIKLVLFFSLLSLVSVERFLFYLNSLKKTEQMSSELTTSKMKHTYLKYLTRIEQKRKI